MGILLLVSTAFLLSLMCGPVVNGQAPPPKLLMLNSLTRHADRSAESDTPINPAIADLIYFRGSGELSSLGINKATGTGAIYRQRYVESLGFLDGRYLPSEVRLNASAVDRVLMSGSAFSTGLFTFGNPTNQPVPGPIYSFPYEDDQIMNPHFACYNGWNDVVNKYGVNVTGNVPAQLLQAMRSSQWNCSDPPMEQSDTLLSEAANPLTNFFLNGEQQKCASGKGSRFMFSFIESLGGSGSAYNTDSAPRLQRTVGGIANNFISSFREKETCFKNGNDTCGPKASFLFGHDLQVQALVNVMSANQGALNFFSGLALDFSVSLALELWGAVTPRGDKKIYVKALIRKGAGEQFLPFNFSKFLPNDYERYNGEATLDSFERAIRTFVGTEPGKCVTSCPPAGIWSAWTPTVPCPTTCGSCSNVTRTRVCTSAVDGCKCAGDATDIGPCGLALCPFPTNMQCCPPYVKQVDFSTDTYYCGLAPAVSGSTSQTQGKKADNIPIS